MSSPRPDRNSKRPGYRKIRFLQNSSVLFWISIFVLLFPQLTRAGDYYPRQSDSPYQKIMESIKKGQEMKTPPKPSPVQPPSTKTKPQDQTPEKLKEQEIAFGPDAETWTLNVTSSLSGTMSGHMGLQPSLSRPLAVPPSRSIPQGA